jgi:hypothetical protein
LATDPERGLLQANNLNYFTMPYCVIRDGVFAKMTFPEQRLYLTLCWLATRERTSSFDTTTGFLRKLTGLSEVGLPKALLGLQEACLLSTCSKTTQRSLHIMMFNPETREVLVRRAFADPKDYPENYYDEFDSETGTASKAKQWVSPEQAKQKFLRALSERGETPTKDKRGNFMFRCPFHEDSTPSCSFNPKMFCFNCFGCGARGNTLTLLTQLTGIKGETYIKELGAEQNSKPQFRSIADAEARYRYCDKSGYLVKEALRFRNDDGSKAFLQRKPEPGKQDRWIWSTADLKPMLYNLHQFANAKTVCICEGEKGCDTVTSLLLDGGDGPCRMYPRVIGTTSGSANSWRAEFAKDLKGFRQIILMPDDDEAGQRYSQAIQESLMTEGIGFHVVSFTGTGAKDVSEYMQEHTVEDLVRLIGIEKLAM